MQTRDKKGLNNPLFGKNKSANTLVLWPEVLDRRAKLYKLIYVYKAEDNTLLGVYPTVECSKTFRIGKDTLTKYLKSGLPYKGKIFTKSNKFK